MTDERFWSEFGFVTPEQHEAALEWERTARDLCTCSHMRQEHFPDRCAHVDTSQTSTGVRRVGCECDGMAPESVLYATETALNASGRGLDTGGVGMTTGACVPSGCQCSCHNPGGMGVAHLVACCDEPPAPIERFGLKLTLADFDELGVALDRITKAERRAAGGLSG